jgi:hypothetical protein
VKTAENSKLSLRKSNIVGSQCDYGTTALLLVGKLMYCSVFCRVCHAFLSVTTLCRHGREALIEAECGTITYNLELSNVLKLCANMYTLPGHSKR